MHRRDVLKIGAAGALAAAAPLSARIAAAETGWSGGGVRMHGESLLGAVKYGPDFPHFDYVNPDAPKGGVARLSVGVPFDTFNPFNAKGRPSTGVFFYVYETLFTPSLDEGSSGYGLLAEWMEAAKDDSWVAFRLRDEAVWHDGRPVTVEDVESSFELLITKGRPLFRFYYADVDKVVDEGDRIVRFRFSTDKNRELPHIMSQLHVLPKHYWADRDFADTTLEPPLGSGPYKIGRFEEARFVEYDRVPDYWGANLPVRVGANNFDTLRFEHFLDRDAAFEAFKKGDIDFWSENSASRWVERFDFPAARRGDVVKREVELEGPKFVQGFVFNTRRAKFADRRVRQALGLAYDFEWTNKAVYLDQYKRASSYFQGTPTLMATGLPDEAELEVLASYRDQLPTEFFAEPFELEETDGSGRNRRGLRRATRLLKEAGLELTDGVLMGPDGAPFTIEFLIGQGTLEKVIAPFIENLKKLGVQATIRTVDAAQYEKRVRSYDFDMVVDGVSNSESPGNEQREFWGSAAADTPGGRNRAGVKNPVVDALIEQIIVAKDRTELETLSRALDRVLLWEHYYVLNLKEPPERFAHWERFGAPDPLPARSTGFPSVWWWDAEKAARI